MQIFENDGTFIKHIGKNGTKAGEFSSPSSLAFNREGTLFVCDSRNERFQVFDPVTGDFKYKFGSCGHQDGMYAHPYSFCFDNQENLVVADSGNNRIQVVTSTGEFIRKFGSVGASPGRISCPFGVAVDSDDNIYVCENGNSRVQVFTQMGTHLRYLCHPPGAVPTGGHGDTQFSSPCGILVDKRGYVVVGDNINYCMKMYDNNGKFLFKVCSRGSQKGQLSFFKNMAFDQEGNIYVIEDGNHRVQIFG